jgi:hypothetical protein
VLQRGGVNMDSSDAFGEAERMLYSPNRTGWRIHGKVVGFKGGSRQGGYRRRSGVPLAQSPLSVLLDNFGSYTCHSM